MIPYVVEDKRFEPLPHRWGNVLALFHDDMTRLIGMNAFNWFFCPISFFSYVTFSLPPSVHPPSRATIAANAAAIRRFSLMFPEKSRHRGEVMHDLLLYNPGSAGGLGVEGGQDLAFPDRRRRHRASHELTAPAGPVPRGRRARRRFLCRSY